MRQVLYLLYTQRKNNLQLSYDSKRKPFVIEECDMGILITWSYQMPHHNCWNTWVFNKVLNIHKTTPKIPMVDNVGICTYVKIDEEFIVIYSNL